MYSVILKCIAKAAYFNKANSGLPKEREYLTIISVTFPKNLCYECGTPPSPLLLFDASDCTTVTFLKKCMVRMQEPPPPFLTVSGLLNDGTDVLSVYGLSRRREHDRSRRFEIVENFKCLEE